MGRITVNFYKENTKEPFAPDVEVNGEAQTLDNNTLNYSLFGQGSSLTDYTITAYDVNCAERSWTYPDLNQFSEISFDAMLLKDVNGQLIDFKFYDKPGENILAGTTVEFEKDGNSAGRVITSTTGLCSLFLNSNEPDYNIMITTAGGAHFQYSPVTVTINPPKNEKTTETISPVNFDVLITGLGNKEFSSNNSAVNFDVFPNTVQTYNIAVDVNSEFYNRKFNLSFRGDPLTYSLQPFLVSVDEAISIKLVTQDSTNYSPISDVSLKLYRFVEGTGYTLIETVVTDVKGEAFVSGIVNQTYDVEVYYQGEKIKDAVLLASSTLVVIRFPRGVQPTLPPGMNALIVFDPPGNLLEADNNILTQTISVNNASIDSITISVYEIDFNGFDGNKLYEKEWSSGIADGMSNDINIVSELGSWDKNKSIRITVLLWLDGNSYSYSAQVVYRSALSGNIGSQVWSAIINDFPGTMGCETGKDCSLLIWLSVMITLLAIGGVAISITRNISYLLVFGIVILTFFTSIARLE